MAREAAAKRAYDKNPALIERYRAGDSAAGEELVLLNRPLVYSIAARFSGRGADPEDLADIGNIGLVKAINTFDPARECAFSTYAVPLIFGEIRRFLRDDGIIKVSREEKRLCAILSAERERRLAVGEEVGVCALARAVGISPEDAASALSSGAPIRSLDDFAFSEEEGVTLGAMICDEDEVSRAFDRLSLNMAIERLTPWQRSLIVLRYYRDMSQSEAARLLGVTQVKISREEKRILAILRAELS